MLGLVLGAGPRPAAAQAPPAAKGTGSTDVLHRLQVCEDGSLMGWGSNANFVLAQPTAGSQYAAPFYLNSSNELDKYAVRATTSSSSFAISPEGTLYAWGDNSLGQLGLGSGPQATLYDTPTKVDLPRPAVSVAAADKFALVLLDDGSVWAWGSNADGELGTGSTGATSYDPVPTLLTSGSTAIACGDGFGLALDQNGQVRAWGRGTHGELGLGALTGPGVTAPQPTPTPIAIEERVRQITASATAVGAILESGEVYTWGSNTSGQLGRSGTSSGLNPTPGPVALPEPGQTLELAVAEQTMCLLLRDGRTLVWGLNTDGAFGDCASPLVSSPVPVDGPRFDGECNQIEALGPRSFAVTSQDGQVFVWGKGPTGYPTYLNSCQPDTPTDLCRARTAPLLLAHADQTSTCAGSTVRLFAVASQPGLTFYWQALNNPAVASTTDPYFTVRLEQSTTFRVTTTLPGDCPGPEATVTVNVSANCCTGNFTAAERLQVNTPYTPATLTFQPYQRYYVHSNRSLVLTGGTFVLPEGATVFLGANANVQLLSGAELVMRGATITSACDTMWTAINVLASAVGIRTETSGSIRSRIQHSISGVVLEDGPAGGTAPRFQFVATDFRHNLQSVDVRRVRVPSTAADQLQFCTFDSDPDRFQVPHKRVSATDFTYSLRHMLTDGDLRARDWTDNTFAHAMYGIFCSTTYTYAHIRNNTFRECYVAGISSGDQNLYHPDAIPSYGYELKLTGNKFYLPLMQPGTPQRLLAASQTPAASGTNSYGATIVLIRVQAFNNLFEQSATYATYNFLAQRELQVGLAGYALDEVEGNTFRRLGNGIKATIEQGVSFNVRGNTFDECLKGIAVESSRFFTIPARYPGLTVPVLYTSCNTFGRGKIFTGRSYGIYREAVPAGTIQPRLYLDNPTAASGTSGVALGATILKDLFSQGQAQPGIFYALYNASTQPLAYTTFQDYTPGNGYRTRYAQYSINTTIQPSSSPPISGVGGNTCQWETPAFFTGIQTRPTQPSGNVPATANKAYAKVSPNPSTGSVLINYHLPASTSDAELVIRRGLDGVLVQQVPLDVRQREHELSLRDYQPGVYLYTLLVDGVPTGTSRLLVQ